MIARGYFFFFFIPAFIFLVVSRVHSWRMLAAFAEMRSTSVGAGFEAARKLLERFHLFDIRVEKGKDRAGSCYLLAGKKVSLAPGDYEGNSLACVGRSLCQAGHALQYSRGKGWVAHRVFHHPGFRGAGAAASVLVAAGFAGGLGALYKLGMILFAVYFFGTLWLLAMEREPLQAVTAKLTEERFFAPGERELVRKAVEAAFLEYAIGFAWPARLGKRHDP